MSADEEESKRNATWWLCAVECERRKSNTFPLEIHDKISVPDLIDRMKAALPQYVSDPVQQGYMVDVDQRVVFEDDWSVEFIPLGTKVYDTDGKYFWRPSCCLYVYTVEKGVPDIKLRFKGSPRPLKPKTEEKSCLFSAPLPYTPLPDTSSLKQKAPVQLQPQLLPQPRPLFPSPKKRKSYKPYKPPTPPPGLPSLIPDSPDTKPAYSIPPPPVKLAQEDMPSFF